MSLTRVSLPEFLHIYAGIFATTLTSLIFSSSHCYCGYMIIRVQACPEDNGFSKSSHPLTLSVFLPHLPWDLGWRGFAIDDWSVAECSAIIYSSHFEWLPFSALATIPFMINHPWGGSKATLVYGHKNKYLEGRLVLCLLNKMKVSVLFLWPWLWFCLERDLKLEFLILKQQCFSPSPVLRCEWCKDSIIRCTSTGCVSTGSRPGKTCLWYINFL